MYCAKCKWPLIRHRSRKRVWCPYCEVWILVTLDQAYPPITHDPEPMPEPFVQGPRRKALHAAVSELYLVRPWEEPWKYLEERIVYDSQQEAVDSVLVPKEGPLGFVDLSKPTPVAGGMRKSAKRSKPSTTTDTVMSASPTSD